MSTRLPETEIANWAFLERSKKIELAERHVRPKVITGTYTPSKKLIPDVLHCHFPLFPDGLERSSWPSVEQRLKRLCKGNKDTFEMNCEILKATAYYAEYHGIKSTKLEALPLVFGGNSYNFAVPSVVRYRDHVAVVFMDMRRKAGLTVTGRNYVRSALYHQTVSQYPDLADAQIEIWRYQNNSDRTLVATTLATDIIPFDHLIADAQETHEVLAIAKSGMQPDRRAASGGGSLF